MGNEIKAIEYSAILADLYVKRAGIDAAIAGVIAASGAMVPGEINMPAAGSRIESHHTLTEIPMPVTVKM